MNGFTGGMFMEDIVVKAEVFRVIRANTDKSARQIIALIRKYLPDATADQINKAIRDFIEP